MKTIYISASKDGKEDEGSFSTRERAEADLWLNNYYLGCVIEREVSEEEYQAILEEEDKEEAEAEVFGYETNLQKFRAAESDGTSYDDTSDLNEEVFMMLNYS